MTHKEMEQALEDGFHDLANARMLIAKQEHFIKELTIAGHDTTVAEKTLERFTQLLANLDKHYARVLEKVYANWSDKDLKQYERSYYTSRKPNHDFGQ